MKLLVSFTLANSLFFSRLKFWWFWKIPSEILLPLTLVRLDWVFQSNIFSQGSSRSTNIQTWKCSTVFILPSLFRRQLVNQYRNWTSLWWNSEFQRCPCLSLSDQYYVAIWRQWPRRLGLWWLIESHLSYRSMLRFDIFFKN